MKSSPENQQAQKRIASLEADNKAAWATNRVIDKARQNEMRRRDELSAALVKAEAFIAGFEGDELQEGIDELLFDIRAAITGGPHDTTQPNVMAAENSALREEMTMANARVKEYKVTYEDGTSSLQPFTEAQAKECGTVLEADGIVIGAAFRLVERWNVQAKLQRNDMQYAIPFAGLRHICSPRL